MLYTMTFPSIGTVKNLFNEFQHCRMSVFDEPHPGALKTATTDDNVTKIHELVLTNHQLEVRETSKTAGVSKDRVGHILHEVWGMKNLSERWVLLNTNSKCNSETTSL